MCYKIYRRYRAYYDDYVSPRYLPSLWCDIYRCDSKEDTWSSLILYSLRLQKYAEGW